MSASRSSGSGQLTNKTTLKCCSSVTEKKKVSINEKAELIEDVRYDEYDEEEEEEEEETYSIDSVNSRAREEREKHVLHQENERENGKDDGTEKK